MTFASESIKNFKLQSPSYYPINNTNFLKKESLIIRIFFSVLPFIALHKPFGRSITLTIDSIRTFTSFKSLIEKKDIKELLKTAISISALLATFFMHPLGIFISTLYDLGLDLSFFYKLYTDFNHEFFETFLSIIQNLFYLGTILIGSLEIIALSLFINMAFEFYYSKKEFNNGNLIEAISHMLMSMVRFSQSLPLIEKIAYDKNVIGKKNIQNFSKTIQKIRDKISIVFYFTARFFISPLWKLTDTWINTIGIYKNNSTTYQKIHYSIKSIFSSFILLPLTLSSIAISQIFHFTAYLLSTKPYIHLKTDAIIKKNQKNLSLFQLNCCLTAGGFSRLFGGCIIKNDKRVDEIAKTIKKSEADLVCLQEVSDLNDAYNLYKKLSKKYCDFYINMGPTPFILKNNSGLFVASKFSIKNPKLYSFSDIEGIESMVNKCFFLFSTDDANFITTHLSPSKDDLYPNKGEIQTRKEEQKRILFEAKKRFVNKKPTFVSGDFNINFNSDEYKKSPFFLNGSDFYNQNRSEISDNAATAETDYLIDRNWNNKKDTKPQRLILDYFLSFFQTDTSVRINKISTFDIKNPKNALSDHSALISEIAWKNHDK